MKKLIAGFFLLVLANTALASGNWICSAVGEDRWDREYFESRCSETDRDAERDALRKCEREFDRRDCQIDYCERDYRQCRGNVIIDTPTNPNRGTLQTHCNCNTGKRCYILNGQSTGECVYECPNGYRLPNNPTVFWNQNQCN